MINPFFSNLSLIVIVIVTKACTVCLNFENLVVRKSVNEKERVCVCVCVCVCVSVCLVIYQSRGEEKSLSIQFQDLKRQKSFLKVCMCMLGCEGGGKGSMLEKEREGFSETTQ